MSSRVYPCLCGFTTKVLSRMKYHRLWCEEWLNRPNPQGLRAYRMVQTLQQVTKVRTPGPCVLCGQWIDHQNDLCLCSQTERVRQDLLLKHGISPADFEKILRVMAKRYGQQS